MLKVVKRTLTCACCGGLAGKHKQWWNQDRGWGICPRCVVWIRSRGDTAEYLRECYGEEGTHYGRLPVRVWHDGTFWSYEHATPANSVQGGYETERAVWRAAYEHMKAMEAATK